MGEPLKVFISYSREDEECKTTFLKHLKPLTRSGHIETFNDDDIIPGDKWGEKIIEKLQKADIIIFLVSPDFYASDYIDKIEMEEALKREARGEIRIIPIIIFKTSLNEDDPLTGKFQGIPKGLKPIYNSKDKHIINENWVTAINELKELFSKHKFSKAEENRIYLSAYEKEKNEKDTIEDWNNYLINSKLNRYKEYAEQRIKQLQIIDNEFFEKAEKENTVDGWEEYKKINRNGLNQEEVENKINDCKKREELEAIKKDTALWEVANNASLIPYFEKYLAESPTKSYKEIAEQKIRDFERIEKGLKDSTLRTLFKLIDEGTWKQFLELYESGNWEKLTTLYGDHQDEFDAWTAEVAEFDNLVKDGTWQKLQKYRHDGTWKEFNDIIQKEDDWKKIVTLYQIHRLDFDKWHTKITEFEGILKEDNWEKLATLYSEHKDNFNEWTAEVAEFDKALHDGSWEKFKNQKNTIPVPKWLFNFENVITVIGAVELVVLLVLFVVYIISIWK